MSRVRNAAIAVSENMACYENLANAIILQAVKDYKRVLHRLGAGMRCTRKKDWNDSFTLRGMRHLQIWMQTA